MKNQEHIHSSIPEYIEEQANHSWQMELFISLGMIFTLARIPSIISKEYQETYINVEVDSLTILIFFGSISLARILLIGFSANLIFRAIWLGILGIYYVYPKGINYENLKFSDFYRSKYNPKLSTLDKVHKLERYSSLSFSIGILNGIQCLGILLMMGICFYINIRLFDSNILNSPLGGYALLFVLVLFSIGIFDKLVFGYFKNVKWLNRVYYPIHKFLSIITLDWLIQNEKLTMASNSGRIKTGLLSFVYIFIAFVVTAHDLGMADTLGMRNFSGLDSREFMDIRGLHLYVQNDEYDDLLGDDGIVNFASIPSEKIFDDYLSIFVTYDKFFDRNFENRSAINQLVKESGEIKTIENYKLNSNKMKSIIDQSIYVALNNVEYDSLNWYIRDHAITKQRGFEATLDIRDLQTGRHELLIKPTLMKKMNEVDTLGGRWIPFLKLKE